MSFYILCFIHTIKYITICEIVSFDFKMYSSSKWNQATIGLILAISTYINYNLYGFPNQKWLSTSVLSLAVHQWCSSFVTNTRVYGAAHSGLALLSLHYTSCFHSALLVACLCALMTQSFRLYNELNSFRFYCELAECVLWLVAFVSEVLMLVNIVNSAVPSSLKIESTLNRHV